jgi:hypothetical protein
LQVRLIGHVGAAQMALEQSGMPRTVVHEEKSDR